MEILLSLHRLDDLAILILRLGIAACFLYHGLQKRSMWKMEPSEKMPAKMISKFKILSIAEPLGGIAMVIGFLTQIAALGFIIIMIGAIQFKAGQMKKKFGEHGGWELDYVLLTANIAMVIIGAEAYSLDRILFHI